VPERKPGRGEVTELPELLACAFSSGRNSDSDLTERNGVDQATVDRGKGRVASSLGTALSRASAGERGDDREGTHLVGKGGTGTGRRVGCGVDMKHWTDGRGSPAESGRMKNSMTERSCVCLLRTLSALPKAPTGRVLSRPSLDSGITPQLNRGSKFMNYLNAPLKN
jgi:hypothetical protein